MRTNKVFSKIPVLLIGILINLSNAFAAGVISSGNWDDSGIWQAGNIGDNINEDVTFTNNIGNVTIRAGYSYNIGHLNMNQGNTLTIEAGSSLTLGASGNNRDLSTGNTTTLNIDGDLIIWGNLNMGNSLTINVSGNVVINGNLNGDNNASLVVNGSMTITGNLTVGNGSTLSGTGTIDLGGDCNDGNSDFCGTGPLPVELLYFKATAGISEVILSWKTAAELNNDFFTIERSENGLAYHTLGRVFGAGTTNEPQEYSLIDHQPIPGTSYYRLKQTDYDGTTETFRPVSVYFESTSKQVVFFPNPVTQRFLNIAINDFFPDSNLSIQIFDLNGRLVVSKYLETNGWGSLEERLDVSEIPQGSYIIELQNQFNSGYFKMIKQ